MRYRNAEPPYLPNGMGAIFKWIVADRIVGRRRKASRRADVPVTEPDRALLDAGTPSLTWIGHATWLIALGGHRVVTDPVWSRALGPGLSRNVPPGLPLDEARPDVVVVSHNHRDHLDAPTIRRIGPDAIYVVPEGLGGFFRARGMREVMELAWWQTERIGALAVTLVPSQHWSQRGPFDRNKTLWGGYVLEADERRVYFAGDTAYFGGFREIGQKFPAIDAALLPIGAYDPEWFMRSQHMNPADAVAAFRDLGARLLCAMHWGTFKLTDEPLDEPPALLRAICQETGVDTDSVWIAAIGESRAL